MKTKHPFVPSHDVRPCRWLYDAGLEQETNICETPPSYVNGSYKSNPTFHFYTIIRIFHLVLVSNFNSFKEKYEGHFLNVKMA